MNIVGGCVCIWTLFCDSLSHLELRDDTCAVSRGVHALLLSFLNLCGCHCGLHAFSALLFVSGCTECQVLTSCMYLAFSVISLKHTCAHVAEDYFCSRKWGWREISPFLLFTETQSLSSIILNSSVAFGYFMNLFMITQKQETDWINAFPSREYSVNLSSSSSRHALVRDIFCIFLMLHIVAMAALRWAC